MTREEAISVLHTIKPTPRRADGKSMTHIVNTIALDLAIEALEQETVSRESYDHEFFLRKELEVKIARLENTIKELEQGQKTGQWVFVDKAHEHAYCSECGYGNVDLFNGRPHNYCPNCGAKMDEERKA